MNPAREDKSATAGAKAGPWVDFALTLPVFLGYQLGVVFLNVRNATDVVTSRLLALSHGDWTTYFALTGGIGLAMFAVLAVLGRGKALRPRKVLQTAAEGAVYAVAMGMATSWVVGKLFAGPSPRSAPGPFAGVVMSLGAGFYEELAFRAVLFGLGGKLIAWAALGRRSGLASGWGPRSKALVAASLWAVACTALFSGMHYVGPLGDAFTAPSFVARAVLGLALTLVYATRGFAAAVWTHALYDVWVLVL